MRSRQSGQAAVETAITMPLFVFLMLGLMQLGLMHQARLLARYAAYKAVRAGSLHRAKVEAMTNAALSAVIPMVARPGSNGQQSLFKLGSGAEHGQAFAQVRNNTQEGGVKIVEVTICTPNKAMKGASAPRDDDDFDDWKMTGPKDWANNDKMKLSAQVTFYFPMIIPFANGVLWHIMRGEENDVTYRQALRLQMKGTQNFGLKNYEIPPSLKALPDLSNQFIYITPIRANWSMRMHSNVLASEIPARNNCKIMFAPQ